MAEIKARIILEDTLSYQIIKPTEAVDKFTESAKVANNVIDMISRKKVNIDTDSAINEIQDIKNEIKDTDSVINDINKKKVDIDTTNAVTNVKSMTVKVKEELKNLKPVSVVVKAVDNTKSVISKTKSELLSLKPVSVTIKALDKTKEVTSKVKSELLSLVKLPVTIAIKAKDETIGIISKIKEGLLNLKTLAAGIVLGAVGKSTIGAASDLEQEQIAMKHFIGYNNPKSSQADVQKMTDSYISQLRTEANATPFSTNEIIAAGRRAVNVTSGDTKQGMDLVKLSENMAALNPGKSVMDAMEALADAKTGEYERMKEFGFKITQNDVNKAGGTDQFFKTQFSSTGNVGKVFAGGANELSSSTAGKWSTVTGNLETIGANFGKAFLPIINTVLTPLGNLLDKNSDKFTNFGESVIKVGGKIKTALTPTFNAISKGIQDYIVPVLSKIPSIVEKYITPAFNFLKEISNKYIMPAMVSIGGVIKKYVPPIAESFGKFINDVKPDLEKFWNIIKVNIIPVVQDLWGKFKEAMPGIQKVVEVAFGVAAKAIGVVIDIFGKVAPVVKDMYDIISPILEGVIWLFNRVADAVKDVYDWFDKLGGKSVNTTVEQGKPIVMNNLLPKVSTDKQATTNKITNVYDLLPQHNALGTSYFPGGLTYINEHGYELVDLPAGSKIYNNRQSMNMLNNTQASMPTMDASSMTKQMASLKTDTSKWGQDIPEGMARGIKANTKSVTDATTFMATKIKELIHFTSPDKGPLSDFDTYAVDMMKTYGTGIQNNTKLVTTPTTNMSTGVKNIYTDLKNQSLTYGQGIVQELGAGIQENTNSLLTIVSDLSNKVIDQFKTSFGIHSPSTVIRALASHIPEGFILGLKDTDMTAFIKKWIGDTSSLTQNSMGNIIGEILQPMFGKGDNKGIISTIYNLVHNGLGSLFGGSGANVSGTVAEWLTAAIGLTGAPMDWLPALEMIAQGESGGDPNSINLYDINAIEGHPSKGLMQLIDENMADYHLPGMTDIYNPIENAAAAIKLIEHDYGTPWNTPGVRSEMSGGSYMGYAQGGIATQPSIFGEGDHPEMAIPLKKDDSRSQYLLKQADALVNGQTKSGINIIIPKLADQIIVREDADIDRIATALAKKLTIAEMNI